jgi:hypothetical protein
MTKVTVPSKSFEEEFVWAFAWMLASFGDEDNKDEFTMSLDAYNDKKCDGIGFLFTTEDYENDDVKGTAYKRRRTLSSVYEWMLMGHEPSRICFQRFMEARLS